MAQVILTHHERKYKLPAALDKVPFLTVKTNMWECWFLLQHWRWRFHFVRALLR